MRDLVFDQWVFGRISSSKRHAVMRTRSEAFRNPVTGESHDLVYTIHSLCGARDARGMVRGSNALFDPSAADNVCTTCSRRWTARHAPQVAGWTKTCTSCGLDKAINQFHVDRRTRDGVSKTCYDCIQGAKAAVKAAEALVEHEAERQRVLAESERRHLHRLTALARFQDSSLLPTFRCTGGHVLAPVRIERESSSRWKDTLFPSEAWTCPCGTRPVTEPGSRAGDFQASLDWSVVFRGVDALDIILNEPLPAPIPMA